LAGKWRLGGQVKLAVLHLKIADKEVGAVAWLGWYIGGGWLLFVVVLSAGCEQSAAQK
jgi:UPF0716 family protein affecting phage T7 exclusion